MYVSRIDWSAQMTVVRTKTADQVIVDMGVDRYKPYNLYVAEFGDPATNGQGHSRCVFMNDDCVMIPGVKEYSVKRRRTHEVEKITNQSCSSMSILPAHLDMIFADLSTSMFDAFPKVQRLRT